MIRELVRVDAAQTARIKHLMDIEVSCTGNAARCLAAERVYEKFNAQLAPLLSEPGVQALFARSAQLAQSDISCFAETAHFESSMALRAFLQTLEPAVARPAADTLFATFLTLMPTFIGERLTLQALRTAWPNLEDSRP